MGERVWIFSGARGHFPSGAFRTREAAEAWIARHRLTGTLTAYPLDEGAYDWAVRTGAFKPTAEAERDADFVANFSSASLEHHHYEDGR